MSITPIITPPPKKPKQVAKATPKQAAKPGKKK